MSELHRDQNLVEASVQSPVLPEMAPTSPAVPARLYQRTAMLIRDRLIPISVLRIEGLGRLGFVGAALLVVGVALSIAVNAPLRQRVVELRAELTSLQEVQSDARVRTPESGANSLLAELPQRADLPVVVASILGQARESGLELERGSYELVTGKNGNVARYRIGFPVRGTYPSVRRFVEATLAAVPAAGVESLRLERNSIAEPEVSADVQFVVFVRSGP